jgi:glycosyltransferase involved in cell wall biosynthesis
MRILLITGSFPPMMCGVGDYTSCLAEALAKQPQTTVGVLTSIDAGTAPRIVDSLTVFPIVRSWSLREALPVMKFIRQWRPDIVHMQIPTQGYGSGRLPYILPGLVFSSCVKVVQTWHEYYTHQNIGAALLPNFLVPGGIITVRPYFKEHMPSFYRWLIGHKRFRFIPNASALPHVVLSPEEHRAVHDQYTSGTKSVVAYFGFIYPHKGVDMLFEIADPSRHHLVLIGAFHDDDSYHAELKKRIEQSPWSGNVSITGFLSSADAARTLAAADAVVLPFRGGGGMWNTSLHGAALQGTFIVTTSVERLGLDSEENIYYSRPGDVDDMRQALHRYLGRRNTESNIQRLATWETIAAEHRSLYENLVGRKTGRRRP